jgi:hypothetical protein
MHSYLKDVAWLCIAVGALFAFPAAAMPPRRPAGQPHQRHGDSHEVRRRAGSEGWPDLRTCLTVMAIGASLLADQAGDYRTRLLTSIPIFAIIAWNVTSWLASRRRRASGLRPPGHSDPADPDYRGRPADPGFYR